MCATGHFTERSTPVDKVTLAPVGIEVWCVWAKCYFACRPRAGDLELWKEAGLYQAEVQNSLKLLSSQGLFCAPKCTALVVLDVQLAEANLDN